jgi:hypothetical protein
MEKSNSYYILALVLIMFFVLLTHNQNLEFFQALLKRDE